MAYLKKMFIDENQRESKNHYPVSIICISIVDIALLIYVIVDNKGLAPMSENWMAGPSTLTLIRNGAKFVPCMKSTQSVFLNYTTNCSAYPLLNATTCTYETYLWYVCNVEKLKGFPYQGYRFFIPIFLHGGVIHLIMNLLSQLTLGIQIERKFGSIRIAVIYILSGIGGILLSAVGLPHQGKDDINK
jgi:membrane associated rhomboid family serine protease